MSFNDSKKRYMDSLYKPDKSKKGSVDKEITFLIDHINQMEDYYTTSSCAGRIVLIELPEEGKKNDAEWLFSSHELVKSIQLDNIKFGDHPVFFKQESFIIHVCAKDLDSAVLFLNKARDAGFRRAGIIAAGKRYIIEILGSEQLTAPIYDGERLLVDQDYLNRLVELGNKNLENVRQRVRRFYEVLKG